jgi:acyl-coenzyme A thioesterase PaaI-like protein
MDRPLQDVLKVHCFGCGALNAHGLRIKSRWDGEDLLCSWKPEAYHIGHPGYVYGGTIASVVDCHCIWTAMAHYCREINHSLDNGPPPFAYVTASLTINFLKPVPIEGEMELRARPVEKGKRKMAIACRVLHGGMECAIGEVVAVRVDQGA